MSYAGLSYLFLKKYGFVFNNYPKIPREVIYFISLLYISMFVSSVFSKHVLTGFLQIIKISTLFYIVYLLYGLIESVKEIKIIISGLFTASVIMALSTIWQLFETGFNFLELSESHHFRSSGLLSNVNAVAGYFVITVPVFIVLLFAEKTRRLKYCFIIIIIINSLGLLIVSSRGGMLALLGSLIYIFSILKRKLLLIMMAIIFSIVLVIFISPWGTYIQTLFRLEQGFSQRDYLWQLSLDMIKNNIFFGVGPGSWGTEMFNYFPVMLDSFQGKLFIDLYGMTEGFNNSHNFYLVFFSDMGILGFITAISLPIVYFRVGFKTINKIKKRNKNLYIMLIGAMAVGVAMFIRSFFEGISLITFGWLTVDLPFWIIFLIVIYVHQNNENFITS